MTLASRSHGFTLGRNRDVVLDLVTLLQSEVTVWHAGLALTGRRSLRYQCVLAAVGARRLAHLHRLKRDLEAEPSLVDDPRWVARQIGRVSVDYLAAPLLASPKSYWRQGMSDAPFFMETWLPIALVGANQGPLAASAAGPLYSSAMFALASVLNRDFRLDGQLRRRLQNFIVTGIAVGGFIALVVYSLRNAQVAEERAADAAEAERQAQTNAKELRRLRREVAQADRVAVEMLTLASNQARINNCDRASLDRSLATLNSLPAHKRTSPTAVADVVQAAIDFAKIDATSSVCVERICSQRELEFLHSFLEVCLTNSRVHGPGHADIAIRIDSRGLRGEVTDGSALPPPDVLFQPAHGLHEARLHASALHGTVHADFTTGAMVACLPPPTEHLGR